MKKRYTAAVLGGMIVLVLMLTARTMNSYLP